MTKTGLCWNGGGAKGIVQVGMYKAFRDLGFDYDIATGVSVGSLNGIVAHQGDWRIMEDLWLSIKNRDVYTWKPWDAFRPFDKRASLYDSNPLHNLLNKYVDLAKAKENPRTFMVNATDLKSNTNEEISRDVRSFNTKLDLVTFLRASAAPPVFFEPVMFEGMVLGDGGLVSNFNIQAARRQGCERIVMFYPSNDPIDPTIDNLLEMLGIVVSKPSHAFLQREMDSTEELNRLRRFLGLSEIQVIFIKPNKVLPIGLLDFEYRDCKYTRQDLIKIGYESAYEVLSNVKSVGTG
jgi:predicted acylesterase/phospholipase RssA